MLDDPDGFLRNLPTVPAKKRGKRCTQLLTSTLTAVENAEMRVERARQQLAEAQVRAAQPKRQKVSMTEEEVAIWEQFKQQQM